MIEETFIGWIDLHEKAWGMDSYRDRPTLKDMLNATVLAFWYPTKGTDSRFTATVHRDMGALNRYATVMLCETKYKQPPRRLARLFINRKKMNILGVKYIVEESADR